MIYKNQNEVRKALGEVRTPVLESAAFSRSYGVFEMLLRDNAATRIRITAVGVLHVEIGSLGQSVEFRDATAEDVARVCALVHSKHAYQVELEHLLVFMSGATRNYVLFRGPGDGMSTNYGQQLLPKSEDHLARLALGYGSWGARLDDVFFTRLPNTHLEPATTFDDRMS